jgi:hypothetical protein
MGIKHRKQTFAEDGTDPNAVHPSDWNDEHKIEGFLALLDTLTAAPNAFPVISADGSAALAAISAPALAMLSKATSAAMLAAIGGVGPDSPSFSGSPTAPTVALGTNNDRLATMAALQAMRSDLTGGAPALLDTLKELSDAIGADPNFASTIATALGNRLRADAAQNLTMAQKAQAIANLALATVATSGAYSDLIGRPTLGTAAAFDVGTTANQVVQLDANSKLPVLDGSQLIGVGGSVSYQAAQTLTDVQRLQAIANIGVPFEHGRLRYVSTSALSFLPFKGDLLKINGLVYRIPSSGVVGLANTGVFVDGVAGQNLAGNKLYYVYVFSNAANGGALTADFSATVHATSAASGNVGVEIKSGDNTRSLLGMVYITGALQFASNLVSSWFNRRTRTLGSVLASSGSPGPYFQEVGGGASLAAPGARCYFLTWADENEVQAVAMINVSVSGGPCNVGAQMSFDGSAAGPQTQQYINTENNQNMNALAAASLSEGLHFAVLFGGANAGTVTYSSYQTVVSGIRG